MSSLMASIKHKGNNNNNKNSNSRRETHSCFFSEVIITLIPKPEEDFEREKYLFIFLYLMQFQYVKSNNVHKGQQCIAMWVYCGNARLLPYLKINQINVSYQQNKDEKLYKHSNRCRKSIQNSISINDRKSQSTRNRK